MATVLRVRNGVKQEADRAAELAALEINGMATRVREVIRHERERIRLAAKSIA